MIHTDLTVEKMQDKQNEHVTYETCITELKNIIQDFQKGNMKLTDAVTKFTRSIELLESCKKFLANFETQLSDEDADNTTNTAIEKIDFEQGLQILDQMCVEIDSNKDIVLARLEEINIQGKKLLSQCKKELEDFQHIIEYTEK